MATDFDNRLLDAASMCMWILREKCNPAEAQVSLALLVGHLCSQDDVQLDAFMHVLRANALQLMNDSALLSRVNERLHNVGRAGHLAVSTEAPEHVYEVGELLHKHKH